MDAKRVTGSLPSFSKGRLAKENEESWEEWKASQHQAMCTARLAHKLSIVDALYLIINKRASRLIVRQ